ncbi:hypothetical protein EVAR_72511_1, partial [Eumeta japonica]
MPSGKGGGGGVTKTANGLTTNDNAVSAGGEDTNDADDESA